MFSKKIHEIRKADVDELVRIGYPENDQVEFKEFVPGKKGPDPWHTGATAIENRGRDEILAEVVGLANARGGHVLIGIQESVDRPKRAAGITPVPRCADLAERLRQAAMACIEPALPDLYAVGIAVDAAGAGVVVLRVRGSRFGPHRLKSDWHCYIRRGDSTEKMTMREIQDSVMRMYRGDDYIDSAFRAFQQEFKQEARYLEQPVERRAVGIRVSLAPVAPLQLHHNEVMEQLQKARRQFQLHHKNGSTSAAQLPVYGFNGRPTLRGFRIENIVADALYRHSAFIDGSQSLSYVSLNPVTSQDAGVLYPEWLYGAVCSVLTLGSSIAQVAESPWIEFALELQVTGQSGATPTLLFGRGWQKRLETSNLAPPRYSYLPEGGSASVVDAIARDLWNSASLQYNEHIVGVE